MEYNPYLVHYGIKGMKWGVRRTDAQLARARGKSGTSGSKSSDANTEKRRSAIKKAAAATAAVVTVAAAATIYAKNPKIQSTVNSVVSKAGKGTVNGIKTAGKKSVEAGKAYVKDAVSGAKAGVKAAVQNAPKKAAEAIVTGIIMNAAKRALDASVGKEEAARIFQANNNKKISSFWKVSADDKDEED